MLFMWYIKSIYRNHSQISNHTHDNLQIEDHFSEKEFPSLAGHTSKQYYFEILIDTFLQVDIMAQP